MAVIRDENGNTKLCMLETRVTDSSHLIAFSEGETAKITHVLCLPISQDGATNKPINEYSYCNIASPDPKSCAPNQVVAACIGIRYQNDAY